MSLKLEERALSWPSGSSALRADCPLAGAVLAAWLVGPSRYRTAEALVAGQITALVIAALLNVEFAWLRNQQLASRG
jgi:hypothetical protein